MEAAWGYMVVEQAYTLTIPWEAYTEVGTFLLSTLVTRRITWWTYRRVWRWARRVFRLRVRRLARAVTITITIVPS